MTEEYDLSGWQSLDIYLFTNGQEQSPPRKYHLTSEQLESWDETLLELAALHYGSQNTHVEIYMLDGKQIENAMQLKHGETYVAVEGNDIFVPAEYKKYLMRASRSWEKSQANKDIKDGFVLNRGESPDSKYLQQLPKPDFISLGEEFNKNEANKVKKRSISNIKLSNNKINKTKSLKGISKNYKTMTESNVKKYTSDISGIKQATNSINKTNQKPTYQFINNYKNNNNLKSNERINPNYNTKIKNKVFDKNEADTKKVIEMNTDNKPISTLLNINKRENMTSGLRRNNKNQQKFNTTRNTNQTNNTNLLIEEKHLTNKRKYDIINDTIKNIHCFENPPVKELIIDSTTNNNDDDPEHQRERLNRDLVLINNVNNEQNKNINENLQLCKIDENTNQNNTDVTVSLKENNTLSTTNNQISAILTKGETVNIQFNYKDDKIEGIITIEKDNITVPNAIDIPILDKTLQTNIKILFGNKLNHIQDKNNNNGETYKYNENLDWKCCGNECIYTTENSGLNCVAKQFIFVSNKNAFTQTEWNNILFVPVRSENNDFALTLPPLELIKNIY